MQGNARREPRLSPHLRCVAGLAFALFALDAATPALAAVAKPTAAASKPPAVAAEKWEGYWAKNRKECRYGDSPDSKTMIDLRNMENGQPAPLYDQYENHCRVDSHAAKGDVATATLQLGRAAQLADTSDNGETLRLIKGVVDVVDASTGTIRLRQHISREDEMSLDARSTRTVKLASDS